MSDNFSELFNKTLSNIREVESGKVLASNEFQLAILNRAQFLKTRYKLPEYSVVILEKKNSIDFFVDFLALYFSKLTIIPIDPTLKENDKSYIYEQSKPSLIISENLEKLTNK